MFNAVHTSAGIYTSRGCFTTLSSIAIITKERRTNNIGQYYTVYKSSALGGYKHEMK